MGNNFNFFSNSNHDTAEDSSHEAPCKKIKLLQCELNTEDGSSHPDLSDSFEDKGNARNDSEKHCSIDFINTKIPCTKKQLEMVTLYEPISDKPDNTEGINCKTDSENVKNQLENDSITGVDNIEPSGEGKTYVNSINDSTPTVPEMNNLKKENNEHLDQENKNEPYFKEHVITRRIHDFDWIMHELHEAFDNNHTGSCKGLFRDLILLRSTDQGLLTQMYWQCKNCFKHASIWSESKKSTNSMSLNESAVLGSLISGIGYTNLKEQLATMNIHFMTDKTYRKHIVNASEIKIPASTVMNVMTLRKYVKESAVKMRKYVENNVEKIKKSNCDRDEQINKLSDILTNMPKHFFGDHSQCSNKTDNDCEGIKENIIASLKLVGIFPIIIQIVSRLSKHADSLLDNLTTNKVEGLNSIANKTLGGRRINYSQCDSFNSRVAIAVIQSDTQEVGTKIHQHMGLKVPSELTKLEKSKKAQALRTEKSRKLKGRSHRRFYGADKSYGKVKDDDMPLNEYNRKEESGINIGEIS
ncbi:Protein of unknown function [Cotesia congregata]|uniref:Mutator-like transposase domain-containing protein n=1 Tax=Cotesia congregata TaxID=51543 RepID=A0A8J2H586_COTCN|nr:Protein of unknown function [Cotesia congregata]